MVEERSLTEHLSGDKQTDGRTHTQNYNLNCCQIGENIGTDWKMDTSWRCNIGCISNGRLQA